MSILVDVQLLRETVEDNKKICSSGDPMVRGGAGESMNKLHGGKPWL